MSRITHLEERLAQTEAAHEQTKAELEQERALRITDETEQLQAERAEYRQRADDAALQLNELTTVATVTRDELARKREVSDERWAQKEEWHAQKERDMAEMKGMLVNMQQMFADAERRREEERAAEAEKPGKFMSSLIRFTGTDGLALGIESIIQELRNENATLRQLFQELSEGTSRSCVFALIAKTDVHQVCVRTTNETLMRSWVRLGLPLTSKFHSTSGL